MATSLAMDKSIRFWDRIAERYAKKPIADPDTYEKKVVLTQKYLTRDANVLEFGCGTGSTALLHAPKVKRLLAIDSSEKMVTICKRKRAESDLQNVEFRRATLFDLDDDAASFEAVLGLNVLHLIDDYESTQWLQRRQGLIEAAEIDRILQIEIVDRVLRHQLPRQGRFAALARPDQEHDPAALECGLQGFKVPATRDHGGTLP